MSFEGLSMSSQYTPPPHVPTHNVRLLAVSVLTELCVRLELTVV